MTGGSGPGDVIGVAAVRVAADGDAAEVGRVLADGFLDDPLMAWLFDEPTRARTLAAFFGFVAREALVPLAATYVLPGGCACWTPPGAGEWPAERGERFGALLERTCTADERRRLRLLDEEMQAHHPVEPLWYLGSIAVERDAQGRGLGSSLLRASLERVDADGLPAYLESSNPRNVPLYERHGFRVTGSIELPGGPALATMWRDARR